MHILYLTNKYAKYGLGAEGIFMEIIISNSSDKPIYEQISSQIKNKIMNGTLETGEMLPSMRALAKDLGKGSFVASQNKEFIQEEQLRKAEELLQQVVDIGRSHGISYEQMANILKVLYEE